MAYAVACVDESLQIVDSSNPKKRKTLPVKYTDREMMADELVVAIQTDSQGRKLFCAIDMSSLTVTSFRLDDFLVPLFKVFSSFPINPLFHEFREHRHIITICNGAGRDIIIRIGAKRA